MITKTLIVTTLITLTPIFELRGGIPYAVGRGVPVAAAYLLAVVVNAAVGPLVFIFLGSIHRFLLRLTLYQRLFARLRDRTRSKVETKVGKYGYLGLALFVAVPLPVTGAYTGALGAWVLGLDPKRSCLAVAAGVLVAGLVVSVVTMLGVEALSIFVKSVAD